MLTSIDARTRKRDGDGALLKDMRKHYDGAPFDGLPLGEITHGFRTRQTEVALTAREIDARLRRCCATGDRCRLLRTETDPEHGVVHVRDVGRARVDAVGNETAVIDPAGLLREFRFDADALHPVAIREAGGDWRDVAFDPIAQQVSLYTDLNGHVVRTVFDPLGNVTAAYKRGALDGRPTETFEYRRDTVPNARRQRVRINHDDVEPGYEKVEYFDGCGRIAQVSLRAEAGRWAVGKQKRAHHRRHTDRRDRCATSPTRRRLPPHHLQAPRPACFITTSPGASCASGSSTGVRRCIATTAITSRSTDRTPPTSWPSIRRRCQHGERCSTPAALFARCSSATARAGSRSVASTTPCIAWCASIDPLGHDAFTNVYDLWGNRIRIRSADGGDMRFVFDNERREVERIDADGHRLVSVRDSRGRVTELRDGSGSTIERYEYDTGTGDNLAGRLARVSGSFGTVEYSYTVEGEATRITRTLPGQVNPFTIRFDYNAHGDVRSVTYPDGSSLEYRYDERGLLQSIPGFVNSVDYGPTGLRERDRLRERSRNRNGASRPATI